MGFVDTRGVRRCLLAGRKREGVAVKRRWLSSIAGPSLVLLAALSSSSAASEQPPTAATKACSAISEGASGNAIEACAQGYKDSGAHSALAASCAFGVGVITAVENEHDCKTGFILAGGGTLASPSPNPQAASTCAAITRGATDGSPAACEQGYEDALAGDTQDASCDHVGEGAITAVEYAIACEDGWFMAKDEPACIPGSDPENGQPGTTIAADAAADKACSAA